VIQQLLLAFRRRRCEGNVNLVTAVGELGNERPVRPHV